MAGRAHVGGITGFFHLLKRGPLPRSHEKQNYQARTKVCPFSALNLPHGEGASREAGTDSLVWSWDTTPPQHKNPIKPHWKGRSAMQVAVVSVWLRLQNTKENVQVQAPEAQLPWVTLSSENYLSKDRRLYKMRMLQNKLRSFYLWCWG